MARHRRGRAGVGEIDGAERIEFVGGLTLEYDDELRSRLLEASQHDVPVNDLPTYEEPVLLINGRCPLPPEGFGEIEPGEIIVERHGDDDTEAAPATRPSPERNATGMGEPRHRWLDRMLYLFVGVAALLAGAALARIDGFTLAP